MKEGALECMDDHEKFLAKSIELRKEGRAFLPHMQLTRRTMQNYKIKIDAARHKQSLLERMTLDEVKAGLFGGNDDENILSKEKMQSITDSIKCVQNGKKNGTRDDSMLLSKYVDTILKNEGELSAWRDQRNMEIASLTNSTASSANIAHLDSSHSRSHITIPSGVNLDAGSMHSLHSTPNTSRRGSPTSATYRSDRSKRVSGFGVKVMTSRENVSLYRDSMGGTNRDSMTSAVSGRTAEVEEGYDVSCDLSLGSRMNASVASKTSKVVRGKLYNLDIAEEEENKTSSSAALIDENLKGALKHSRNSVDIRPEKEKGGRVGGRRGSNGKARLAFTAPLTGKSLQGEDREVSKRAGGGFRDRVKNITSSGGV